MRIVEIASRVRLHSKKKKVFSESCKQFQDLSLYETLYGFPRARKPSKAIEKVSGFGTPVEVSGILKSIYRQSKKYSDTSETTPYPSWTAILVHAQVNRMKILEHVGTVVGKLWWNFQPNTITLEGDIQQIRVKNSSSDNSKFLWAFILYFQFVLFERVCQYPGHDSVFFKFLFFNGIKVMRSAITQKPRKRLWENRRFFSILFLEFFGLLNVSSLFSA